LIRRPFRGVQSEGYGHSGGHLSRRARAERCRHSSNELADERGAVQPFFNLLVLVALVVYGFCVSLGGRGLFSEQLPEVEAAG